MVFSSMVFLWIFLPVLLIIYYLIKDKYKNYILLIFSLLFYSWGEPKYILLMLFSIVVNYFFGLFLNKKKNKIFLIIAIVFNIGMLFYFKYFNFVIGNINTLFNTSIINKSIPLPIGISFYTFQILSYIIDLYNDEIKVQKNIIKLALYISFFPQLIAGPIVRYKDIEEQIDNRNETIELFSQGVKRFTYGLGKKVIFANSLALIVDSIYKVGINSIPTWIAWLGSICYTLQIYFDFSGYSDMAIGLGKMFGFNFNENFNLPYISKSITEFWRRWHISLSTWFKEYLYIPLGGNRKGNKRTYLNLWIVFLVTGIWHGASWNFIVWGLFHGLFIFIERLGFLKILKKFKFINFIYTIFVVNIAWVFFRAPTLKVALLYLKKMFIFDNTYVPNLINLFNNRFIFIFILSICFSGIFQSLFNKNQKKLSKYIKYVEPIGIFIIMFISIMLLVSDTYNPFIYFRF